MRKRGSTVSRGDGVLAGTTPTSCLSSSSSAYTQVPWISLSIDVCPRFQEKSAVKEKNNIGFGNKRFIDKVIEDMQYYKVNILNNFSMLMVQNPRK